MQKPKYILSLDPGASTGFALFEDGVLVNVRTVSPLEALSYIMLGGLHKVIVEDSTLQSKVFTAPKVTGASKLKIARNIGEIDGYCKLIKLACEDAKIPCHQISPMGKGAKLKAPEFTELTKWAGKTTNQHERDAVMVGWMYRGAV